MGYLSSIDSRNSAGLNCYELDEWYQRMEDRAYDDIADNDDVELDDDDDDDDHDLKAMFYPEEL
jgi:hypothetical protein